MVRTKRTRAPDSQEADNLRHGISDNDEDDSQKEAYTLTAQASTTMSGTEHHNVVRTVRDSPQYTTYYYRCGPGVSAPFPWADIASLRAEFQAGNMPMTSEIWTGTGWRALADDSWLATEVEIAWLKDLGERYVRARISGGDLSPVRITRCWFDPHLDSRYLDSYPDSYPDGPTTLPMINLPN